MTTFENGPAKGQKLLIGHSPKFLRVVEANEKWDALDHPTDRPEPSEKLYAYCLSERLGTCHINAGRGRSGFYPIARYRFLEKQPTDPEMRTADAWQQWCQQNDV